MVNRYLKLVNSSYSESLRPSLKRDMSLLEMTRKKYIISNSRKNIFSNPRVRLALSYAYDHEWINKALYNNAYTRTDSYFDNSPLASSGVPSKLELEFLNPWKDHLPKKLFTSTYMPPVSDGSGMPRKNLRIAKKILEEEGWNIENGKLTKTVKNPNYRGVTTPFWNNLKMVGDRSTFEIYGTPHCGKGEPNQTVRVGHASPTCLFSDIEIFGGA